MLEWHDSDGGILETLNWEIIGEYGAISENTDANGTIWAKYVPNVSKHFSCEQEM